MTRSIRGQRVWDAAFAAACIDEQRGATKGTRLLSRLAERAAQRADSVVELWRLARLERLERDGTRGGSNGQG